MPTGSSLKNRLTLWTFLLLLPVLGAGGFFCYYTQQLEQTSHLDKQLLFIARNFACSYRDVAPHNSASSGFCDDFDRRTIHHAGEQAARLYSLQGEILCNSQHPYNQQLELTETARSNSLAGRTYLETVQEANGESFRRLTYPIILNDQVRYHLQLAQQLKELQAHLNRFFITTLLATAGLALLLAAGQWLLLGRLLSPLKKLSARMDKSSEENLAHPFPPEALPGKEFQQLAISYNGLTDRMSSVLHRSRQFATDVTHELRTPLTILRGETELALRGNKNADELKQVLNSNLEELSRMGHLVDDLLLLSKSELGEIPLKMEALNLNGLMEVLHFHGTIIAEPKQIKVELQGPTEQVSLYADANRIRQVFLNLLTNGIKYTPEGGTVTIDWALQGEMVRIIFQDTGIGIDSEHQQHIFDRFYRINKTGNRNDGGSGLGLAISKWLVEAHGGSIMVCSAPGQGSSFAILLPLAHKPEQKKTG